MKKILVLLTAFLIAGCMEDQPAPIQPALAQYFEASSLPSAIMGITTQSGDHNWYAFGPSVWDSSGTVSEHHIFRIASMTKAVTSVAALQLVEQGLLDLDEPLDGLMPEMASIPILNEDGDLVQSTKPITLRHLLTHTSGFAYPFTSSRLSNFDRPEDWKYEDNPRLFEPGARWQYGTSTDWAGKVVEKVSGQDLENYFKEHITGPLNMTRTFFNVPDSLSHDIVSWGSRDSSGFTESQRIPQQAVTSYSGGGGLFSSPHDYLIFLECLLNDGAYEGGRILKAETVAMMTENHLPPGLNLMYDLSGGNLVAMNGAFPDTTDKHGLSWAIEDSEDEAVRSEGAGYWAGIGNSYYTIDRKEGIAVVYFTQFLPFNDKESYDFYRLFEKQAYKHLKTN